MVEETDVTLTFTLYPSNDIPYGGAIYVYWPESWKEIDCSLTFTTACTSQCSYPTGLTVGCNDDPDFYLVIEPAFFNMYVIADYIEPI